MFLFHRSRYFKMNSASCVASSELVLRTLLTSKPPPRREENKEGMLHAYTHTNTHTHRYIYIYCICMYDYIYIYIYTLYTHIHTDTTTHTHTFHESDHPQPRRLPVPRLANLLKQPAKFNVSAVNWGVSSVAQPSQFRVT